MRGHARATRAVSEIICRELGLHSGSLRLGWVPTWTGFRLVPEAIEFWTRRAHRLHERELFLRRRGAWSRRLLQP